MPFPKSSNPKRLSFKSLLKALFFAGHLINRMRKRRKKARQKNEGKTVHAHILFLIQFRWLYITRLRLGRRRDSLAIFKTRCETRPTRN